MTNRTRIKVHAPDWVRTCDVVCGRQKYPCRQAFLIIRVTLTTSTHVTGDKVPVSDLECYKYYVLPGWQPRNYVRFWSTGAYLIVCGITLAPPWRRNCDVYLIRACLPWLTMLTRTLPALDRDTQCECTPPCKFTGRWREQESVIWTRLAPSSKQPPVSLFKV
jgi:hypothetical protein